MGFRFWRRVQILPGVTLNLSKSTMSLSVGPRGARYTISPRGNRVTLGVPGTGLFYTVQDKPGTRPARPPRRDRLSLGFWRRLVTPAPERALIEGLRALDAGNAEAARAAFVRAGPMPDAAWMAGVAHLRAGEPAAAEQALEQALAGRAELGQVLGRYGVAAEARLALTPEILAHIGPCERGTRLALAELAQRKGQTDIAAAHLEAVLTLDPQDRVALLAWAELMLEGTPDRALLEQIIARTESTENETAVDTALLMYRARALAGCGLHTAAIDTATRALRRRKGRPEALMQQLRHDRARLYHETGQKARARREFEKLYAEDPDFADLRARLGLGSGPQ